MKKEDQVVESIIQMIIQGDYDIGDQLPAERQLSEMFQTSRHTLRGAIRQLAARGVLEVRPGSGCFITAAPAFLKDWAGPGNRQDRSTHAELLEACFFLNPRLGAVAAENAGEEDVEALENCLTRISKAIMSLNTGDLAVENRRFMDQIARCVHNRYLEQTGRQLNGVDHLFFGSFPKIPKDEQEAVFADYVEIVKAIKKRDSELAASRIRDHIVRLSRLLIRIHPLEFSGSLRRAIEAHSE